ncbi:hypothetical protein [Parvularcula marina]|uniref:hypothetical protein n=1 Tax=Parvularcula marina TaxID=2292771 RepID=UPI0035144CBD
MAFDSANQKRRQQAAHISFLKHANFKWAKFALVISALAAAGYFFHDPLPRPNGGTILGYTLGTIGALLILWLTMLGIRKRRIAPGNWSLKGWTSAHVYLGLSLIVIGTLHTGFQFGWNIHTLAYGAMIVVILSGLVGIWFYAVIPEKMGRNRDELTREQMVAEINAFDRQLTQQAQPLPPEISDLVKQSVQKTKVAGGVLSRLAKRAPTDATDKALEKLRRMHPNIDGPDRQVVDQLIATLERKQTALGRARRHVRYKTMLELWLYVHVPITFLLLAALTAHIVSVFFYW